jgi:hypothetical protein
MSDRLPAKCPDCATVMETRDDVLVHALAAVGDDDHRASFGGDSA